MTRFFNKLSNKFLTLLFLSTAIPVAVVSLYGVSSSTKALRDLALTRMENDLSTNVGHITNFTSKVKSEVAFLSWVPPIQGIVRAREGNGFDRKDSSTYDAWVKRGVIIFKSMMQNQSYYLKLRYLDEQGKEMVRIDRTPTGTLVVTPEAALVSQSDAPAFLKTIGLKEGQFHVSSIRLDSEKGAIVKPYQPIMQVTTPIYNPAGQVKGMLVADVSVSELLKTIETANTVNQTVLLVNQTGYYLSAPNAQKEWGEELNLNANLKQDYPSAVAAEILSKTQGSIDQNTDQIISYQRATLDEVNNNNLTLVYQAPKQVVFASVTSFRNISMAFALLSLGAVLGVGTLVVSRITRTITQAVNAISTSSTGIGVTVEQHEQTTTQQATAVNQTTTTMDELSASSRQSADQAEAAANGAKQVLTLVNGHNLQAGYTSSNGSSLHEKVGQITEQILHLSEQTSQIGIISTLVSDLANQTNMLALNAAVEAVRAGEHGKGFGVVASEIRKLADQSKKSAERINALVVDIKNATNSTVMVTDEGSKTVETIVTAVNEIALTSQQISLTAKQQAIAIQQVGDAMSVLNQNALQTASGITQTKVGTQKLNDAALNLKAIV